MTSGTLATSIERDIVESARVSTWTRRGPGVEYPSSSGCGIRLLTQGSKCVKTLHRHSDDGCWIRIQHVAADVTKCQVSCGAGSPTKPCVLSDI